MENNGPFGFDPDDVDRVVREAGEGLRDVVERFGRLMNTPGEAAGFGMLFDEFTRRSRPRTQPETAGEAGTFDGFVDARFDEPFDVVLVGCALVGEGVDEGEVGGVVVKGGAKGAREAEVLGERARGVVAFGVRADSGA